VAGVLPWSGVTASRLSAKVLLSSRKREVLKRTGQDDSIRSPQALDEALRTSREPYRLLFDKNPQPMWIYDLGTLNFLAVNEAAVREYGYSQEEFLRMSVKAVRPVEELASFVESLSKPWTAFEK
jgi:PAS domain-containing protein